PAINRVLQAAGRVIRSETDRGVVLLIDRRFTVSSYRRLLPAEWKPVCVRESKDFSSRLSVFWGAGNQERRERAEFSDIERQG
ncbi:MAG TPA: helicase C-terminal domain-containing protein, partial [Bacteroidales bacterium]|nr:helicase C-terminal domain-containing protein [Bacteroidales bacterium]